MKSVSFLNLMIGTAFTLPIIASADPVATSLESPFVSSAITAKANGCRFLAVRFDYADSTKTDVSICRSEDQCEKFVTLYNPKLLQSRTELQIQSFDGKNRVLNRTVFNGPTGSGYGSSSCRADEAFAQLKDLF